MQLVHPRPKVNYRRVIDALADSIAELNSVKAECVAPAAHEAPSFDVDGLVELLRTLDQRAASGAESAGYSLGDAAADAAAEHSASSQEFLATLAAFGPAIAALGTLLGLYNVGRDLYGISQGSRGSRRSSRR